MSFKTGIPGGLAWYVVNSNLGLLVIFLKNAMRYLFLSPIHTADADETKLSNLYLLMKVRFLPPEQQGWYCFLHVCVCVCPDDCLDVC